MAALAWLAASIFYQYVLRSAPAVMVPELTSVFGVSAVKLAALIGLFYYGYATFSMVAGVALDQLGARKVVIAQTTPVSKTSTKGRPAASH